MKKNIKFSLIFLFLLLIGGPIPAPAQEGGASGKASMVDAFDALSTVRVYIEFYFMESGDYPDSIKALQEDLNSLLPRGLENIAVPKDPATGTDFIYSLSENGATYTLAVPDPSAYGLKELKLGPIPWAGFKEVAKERKQKFLQMLCYENIKVIATAVEYFAKDNKGKYPTQLKELIPEYLKTMPVNPIGGESYKYEVSGDNYKLSVPNPKEYGLEKFFYSSDRGFVIE